MSFVHVLSRDIAWKGNPFPFQAISRQLKRSKSTIKYELNRCKPYNTFQAQRDYDAKRKNCGRKRTMDLDRLYPDAFKARLVACKYCGPVLEVT